MPSNSGLYPAHGFSCGPSTEGIKREKGWEVCPLSQGHSSTHCRGNLSPRRFDSCRISMPCNSTATSAMASPGVWDMGNRQEKKAMSFPQPPCMLELPTPVTTCHRKLLRYRHQTALSRYGACCIQTGLQVGEGELAALGGASVTDPSSPSACCCTILRDRREFLHSVCPRFIAAFSKRDKGSCVCPSLSSCGNSRDLIAAPFYYYVVLVLSFISST